MKAWSKPQIKSKDIVSKDDREALFHIQRKIWGFDNSDTWSLDMTIAQFVLPRLKRLKEINNGYPVGLTEKKWDEILDNMIYAMEYCADDENWFSEEYAMEAVHLGLQQFGKYFLHLWW